MRILFIRHGDPDYGPDTLTDRGIREAEALSELLVKCDTGDCYTSPLGRAKLTSKIALSKTGKTAEELLWLQEFITEYDVNEPGICPDVFPDVRPLDRERLGRFNTLAPTVNPHVYDAFRNAPEGAHSPRICWDLMPAYYTGHPELSDPVDWRSSYVATHGGLMPDGSTSTLLACYDYVCRKFDAFLDSYGYRREEGGLYRTPHGHEKTVTLFCHFGITAVLLSRLWNTSPFFIWQSMCMAPSSVTEVVTEERREGYAYFRALRIGDISHLNMAGKEASFSARFCESFDNPNQRH